MTWLTETSTWEPAEGDPNIEYSWLERYTLSLLHFRNPTWSQPGDWLTSTHVCEWSGLSAKSCPGPITEIDLGKCSRKFAQGNWIGHGREMLLFIFFQILMLIILLIWSDSYSLPGTIPSEIGRLTSFTYLDLSKNLLEGNIPSEIGNLVSLTYLNLKANGLAGSIPSEIGNLVSLAYLNFRENQLIGSIPSSMVQLRNSLAFLDLGGNQLTGTIPPGGFGWLSNLSYLNLLPNNFTVGETFPGT